MGVYLVFTCLYTLINHNINTGSPKAKAKANLPEKPMQHKKYFFLNAVYDRKDTRTLELFGGTKRTHTILHKI